MTRFTLWSYNPEHSNTVLIYDNWDKVVIIQYLDNLMEGLGYDTREN